MSDFEVVVLGGGPAGHAAALKAAELGARTALVEREKLGGACVNFSCIPTDVLLASAATYLDAQELSVAGVVSGAGAFNYARAAARARQLVEQVSTGVTASLRLAKVEVISGRGVFVGPATLRMDGEGGRDISADGFVIATGTRWEAPEIPGFPSQRVLTPDAVQSLTAVPSQVVVHDAGAAGIGFGVEYAFLLALSGAEVSLATASKSFLPGLDPAVAGVARATLADAGVQIFEGAKLVGSDGGLVITHDGGTTEMEPDAVVEADPRQPLVAGLGLDAAGVRFGADGIPVDTGTRTSTPGIFAAGDVTGGAMLSSAAAHQGAVAGENACGGNAVARPDRIPRVLQVVPGIGWVGATEQEAAASGEQVVSGVFDLSFNAKAVTLGAREGVVKIIASRSLGEILGVHAVGPGTAEILNVAAFAMQAEIPLDDLASFVAWHPSLSEGLVQAAARANAAR